ncbi:MAG: methyl-accepting chemotaxis protein, partial [Firmicutes bacterium]|nr:methyl-accepting chemotaxis protein [Bacillota bacterium]
MLSQELRVLEELARRSEIQSLHWPTQRQSLLPDVERLGYLDMGIMDLAGNATYVLTGEKAWLGDRVYFQQAVAGTASVSDVIISRVTNQPVVMYAVPIMRGDELVGVLIARKDAEVFSNIVDRMGYGENGYAAILGKDGTIYAHPD